MEPQPFGRYQLIRRIATGGMAEIYLARALSLGGFEKRLVIKRLLPAQASRRKVVDLFFQEARLTACFSHPNIVQIFDLGKVDDEPYIAMEYVHGKDLSQVLRALRLRGEKMPVGLAVHIATRVARGLAHAHGQRQADGAPLPVIHRDISPQNVILSFQGEVKIVDFGIAQLGLEGENTLQAGKFAYMSPEQASGRPVDHRSDLYSLGLVLQELLTNRRSLPDGDTEERREAAMAGKVKQLAEMWPAAPPPLCAILARILAPALEDRYSSAVEVEEALRAFLFSERLRVEPGEIGQLLRRLFPGEEKEGFSLTGLDQLARDLVALTGLAEDAASHPPGGTLDVDGTEGGPLGHLPTLLNTRGERRAVVVMAVEMAGMTVVSEHEEAEAVGRLRVRLLRRIRAVVDRLGGLLQRVENDTLTIFFGLPRSFGDDLERALACAQELHSLAQRLRRRGWGVELSIGVHAGEITVGKRDGARYRFTAHGDVVKLALRLALLADASTTLLSDRVGTRVADRFSLERGLEIRRKGQRSGLPTWRLVAPRRASGKGAGGRWYRRGEELELLRGAVAGLREGRGAWIGVQGEAGLGKSRLIRDLRELTGRRGVRALSGRVLPYGSERPFALFRDVVVGVLGPLPEGAQVRPWLEGLSGVGLEPADVDMIGTLFGLEAAASHPPSRESRQATLSRLIQGVAADGPVVLLLEDVQHLEPIEMELFEQLLRATDGAPVLLVASWRGELRERWLSGFQLVRLAPLTLEQVTAMAAELMGTESLSPELEALLHRTAEGNPLYLEEILKALQRAGRIWYEGRQARLRNPDADPGLPDSVQGLITARVDALPLLARAALQVAAMVGIRFEARLVAAAIELEDPSAFLGELQRAGLVAPDAEGGASAFMFSSVLIWECVMRAIPLVSRRDLHRRIALGMESALGAEKGELLEAYAGHCHEAGLVREAAIAMVQVAEQLRRAWFLDRSLACYQRGIDWLEEGGKAARDTELEAALYRGAGEVALLLGQTRAESLLQVALELASEANLTQEEARAQLALGKLCLQQGKHSFAGAYLSGARPLFHRVRDRAGEVDTLEAMAQLAREEGQPEKSLALHTEGLEVAGGDPALEARMRMSLSAWLLDHGENEEARLLLEQCLPLAEASRDRLLLGRIYNNLGLVALAVGDPRDAIQQFKRALEVRRGLGYRKGEAVNLHNLGDAWLALGQCGRASAAFEESRDLARAACWEPGVVMNEVYLAYLRGLRGEPMTEELARLEGKARRLGDRRVVLMARWLRGLLAPEVAEPLDALVQESRSYGLEDLALQILHQTGIPRHWADQSVEDPA